MLVVATDLATPFVPSASLNQIIEEQCDGRNSAGGRCRQASITPKRSASPSVAMTMLAPVSRIFGFGFVKEMAFGFRRMPAEEHIANIVDCGDGKRWLRVAEHQSRPRPRAPERIEDDLDA